MCHILWNKNTAYCNTMIYIVLNFELLCAIFIKLQNTCGSINFMLNLKLIIVCCYSYLMNILTIS